MDIKGTTFEEALQEGARAIVAHAKNLSGDGERGLTGYCPGSDPSPAQPRYKYTDTDGEHLHSLDGKPLIGTSTAVQVLAKPLTWWAAGMALTPLGWLNVKKSTAAEREYAARRALNELAGMSCGAYAKLLEKCYRAHHTRKETAAVTGTDMHACLERYITNCVELYAGEPTTPDEWEHEAVERFHDWATEHVAGFLWSEGHCYSETLWTGGICDCGAMLKTDELAVIDFKSSREAYFSQFVQGGGYALQIRENGVLTADGQQVLSPQKAGSLIIFPFGSDVGPSIIRHVKPYVEAFKSAVCLHKLQQDFGS